MCGTHRVRVWPVCGDPTAARDSLYFPIIAGIHHPISLCTYRGRTRCATICSGVRPGPSALGDSGKLSRAPPRCCTCLTFAPCVAMSTTFARPCYCFFLPRTMQAARRAIDNMQQRRAKLCRVSPPPGTHQSTQEDAQGCHERTANEKRATRRPRRAFVLPQQAGASRAETVRLCGRRALPAG